MLKNKKKILHKFLNTHKCFLIYNSLATYHYIRITSIKYYISIKFKFLDFQSKQHYKIPKLIEPKVTRSLLYYILPK